MKDREKDKNEVIVRRCLPVRGMRAKKSDVKAKIRRCNTLYQNKQSLLLPFLFFLASPCFSYLRLINRRRKTEERLDRKLWGVRTYRTYNEGRIVNLRIVLFYTFNFVFINIFYVRIHTKDFLISI